MNKLEPLEDFRKRKKVKLVSAFESQDSMTLSKEPVPDYRIEFNRLSEEGYFDMLVEDGKLDPTTFNDGTKKFKKTWDEEVYKEGVVVDEDPRDSMKKEGYSSIHRKRLRDERRDASLSRLVPDRHCLSCGALKLGRGAWFVVNRSTKVDLERRKAHLESLKCDTNSLKNGLSTRQLYQIHLKITKINVALTTGIVCKSCKTSIYDNRW